MLHLLRRSVKSWVAKVLLGLLIISFGVWGIGDIFVGTSTRNVAGAGDAEISAQRFARAMQRQQNAIQRERQQVITYANLREAGIDRAVIAGLVRDAAASAELDARQIAVPTDKVREAIRSNPRFQDGEGGFSTNAYLNVLGQLGYSGQEYEQLIRELLGQQILAGAVSRGTGALPGVAEAIAKWQGEARAISVLALTPDSAPDPGEPTDADLRTFFEADIERFRVPERRWGRYLRVNPAEIAREMMPTDEETRAEYDARIDAFTTQPNRTVEQIVFKDGVAAADAARRLADESASWEEIAAEQNIALDNLALGQVTERDVPAASAKAIFALTEPGIAGPVQTLSGHALFKVTAVETGSVKPFEEVKDQLAQALANRRALGAVSKRANEINEIRAGGATMAEIAEKTGLALVGFAGLAANGTVATGAVPALAADPRFVTEMQAALDGEERNIIELVDGGYALVMIGRIADSHLPELDAVKDDVTGAWALEERLKALEARATSLVLKAASEGGLAAIAEELGETPSELPAFTRAQMPPTMSEVTREQIFSAAEGDLVIGRARGNQSVLLITVREVRALEGDALAERVTAAETALASSIAGDQLEFHGRAMEERHGAFVNPEAVEAVFEQLGQARGGF